MSSEENLPVESRNDKPAEVESSPQTDEGFPPLPRAVRSFMMEMTRTMGPNISPLVEKMESTHVSKLLELHEKSQENEFKGEQQSRYFLFATFLVILIALGTAMWFLVPTNQDTFFKLIEILGSAVLGFLGGYGLKASKGSHPLFHSRVNALD